MTSTELEQVDEIRRRFDISYEEAVQALRENGGDLLQALIAIERRQAQQPDPIAAGLAMLDQVEGLTRSGPIRRIRLKYANRLVKDIPVFLTASAAVGIALLAVFINRCSIELEQESDEEHHEA